MSVLVAKISTARPTSYLNTTFETPGGNHSIAQNLLNFVNSVQTGSEGPLSSTVPPQIIFTILESEVQASGTLTLASVVATNTATINGVVFTAIASGAGANQFNVGLDDTATAVNLAAAINGSVTALIPGYVTATSALAVVTVTAVVHGLSGNAFAFLGGTNITAAPSGHLAGGIADPSALTIQF